MSSMGHGSRGSTEAHGKISPQIYSNFVLINSSQIYADYSLIQSIKTEAWHIYIAHEPHSSRSQAAYRWLTNRIYIAHERDICRYHHFFFATTSPSGYSSSVRRRRALSYHSYKYKMLCIRIIIRFSLNPNLKIPCLSVSSVIKKIFPCASVLPRLPWPILDMTAHPNCQLSILHCPLKKFSVAHLRDLSMRCA